MPETTPKNPPNMPEYREGAGPPPPAHDSSPGAQGSSSAGGPDLSKRDNSKANKPKVTGQAGYAGEEVAIASRRTNWPDHPERYEAANLQSASGHRPPTLAKDPVAPVYVPGDPNTLIPGEVDSGNREVKPTPYPLPDEGDEDYMVRPEPALDDIARGGGGRTQEAAALEQANSELREKVVTREGGEYFSGAPGKGELQAESSGLLGGPNDGEGGEEGNTKRAQPYRPSAKQSNQQGGKPATRQPTQE